MKRGTESLSIYRGFKPSRDADRIIEDARARFDENYEGHSYPAVVVIIAAWNEADSLPTVLAEIPDRIASLPAEILLVDDGSHDGTSEVGRQLGASIMRLASNCGHGVALRAGYRVAWEHGAKYIATLDADGQWDPTDLHPMVSLVVEGHADFVIGSRALGGTKDTDPFRTLGVRVFSFLARILTGVPVTDTSSGLRVMTSRLLQDVPQTQAQYQTSELVIGAALAGYRIAEVPTVMRPRISGTSRKGNNFAYGLRYALVMVSTWCRERHRQRRNS
jgi:glycosyltransferase involved in cell wall biosynthesis